MLNEKIINLKFGYLFLFSNLIIFAAFILVALALSSLERSIYPSFLVLGILLLISCRYYLIKLGKTEKNNKLNKIGKIFFWIGIFLAILAYIVIVTIATNACKYTSHAECGFGYGILLILFEIISLLTILIGTILWIKSNYGGKNTFKLSLMFIASLIMQWILMKILGYVYFKII
ncbi:hypothetical protein C4573_02585 [Candidatus Woesearchaeota archaeon]|nr:MAG: hypothetical protein C4573_02585 [Candidatus Woesearchaeota archaeon]